MASRQTIQAPPATPPLYSLLVAADVLEDGERWHQGVQWAPEGIAAGGVVAQDCHGNSPDGKDESTGIGNQSADPFVVFAEDHCSTIGFEARDFEGRARRQLAAVQSALIAAELQFGAIAGDTNGPVGAENAALVDGVEISGGGPVQEVIPALDQYLATLFSGRRSMIHVTPQTLDTMLGQALIQQQGQKWVTALGTIVVADAGYIDESGTVFAYGTSMVQVRLSPVDLLPGTFEAAMAQMVDRSINKVTLYAERLALVQFDNSDAAVGDLIVKIETDLVPPSPGS